ncbi:MAG: SDR family NAD(P)-dependent oxidoreductase [Alphaproteobacteria bacterium]|nr:SDR family NAD(P)-dependent oxidoreductase [Alphaproteobacteria bacterium]
MADKVAVVTGAARGIGAGVASGLAANGYRVALIGLEGDLLRSNARALGDRAMAFEADVTDRIALTSAFESIRERWGRIDAVVSNAGISNYDLLRTMSPDHFERVINVNLGGTFNTIQASFPALKESKGYFLGVASIAAAAAPPGMAAYGASKSATESICDTFRAEVVHLGIAVGVAYFGWLDTDLVKTGEGHAAFQFMRKHLPGPLRAIASVDIAVKAIVDGVERRRHRVMAPGWLRFALASRWLISGRTGRYRELMPEIERLCAEELKKRGGREKAMLTDPMRRLS